MLRNTPYTSHTTIVLMLLVVTSIQTNMIYPDLDSITNTVIHINANGTLFLFQKTATDGHTTHLIITITVSIFILIQRRKEK